MLLALLENITTEMEIGIPTRLDIKTKSKEIVDQNVKSDVEMAAANEKKSKR